MAMTTILVGDHALSDRLLATGYCLATFMAGEALYACAVTTDRLTIVAGGASGRVHFLRLETD